MRIITAFVAFSLVAACQAPPAEMTEAEIAQIEAQVKQAATDQMNIWLAQEDLDAHVADHSAWAGNPWGGTRTLQQMRQRQAGFWEQYDWAIVEAPEWEVRVLGPEAAAVKGTLTLSRTDIEGGVRTHISDWAEVWVVEDGRWKILVAKDASEWIED